MAQPNFDYEGARSAGYAEEEINDFLQQQPKYKPTNQKEGFFKNIANNASNFIESIRNLTGEQQQQEPSQQDLIDQKLLQYAPNFDVKGALEAGYNPEEINEFLSTHKPERSSLEQATRLGAQYGLGVLQGSPSGIIYDIATAPLASKEAQLASYRENLGEDIENLLLQKSTGVWSEQDETLLQNLQEQIRHPEKSEPFIQTADISLRGLTEKATGMDLQPEGILEKAASWAGLVKDPKKLSQLAMNGIKLPQVMKTILPTGTEAMRGIGAGIALQMAEEGNFGPIGTMAATVVGDIAGMGAAGTIKGVTKLFTQRPKKTLAQVAKVFTPKDKIDIQKKIIKDFRQSGIQADLGTITDSNLIKWIQSRLAQSGFSGKALDEFKEQLTGQIKEEYKTLAEGLGEAKFLNSHEAGETVKTLLRDIRDADLRETRGLYAKAEESLKDAAYVNPDRLAEAVEKLEKSLLPGSIKSTEQKAVLNALDHLKKDIYDSSGSLMFANVKDLMNNKIALNDVINYEVQGGAKQLLKGIVNELDRAIISHGKENPAFAKNYVMANRKFAEHAKNFRSKRVDKLFRLEDPAKIMNNMNSIQGIRDLENILKRSPNGKEASNNLKRLKLDQIVNDNLIDSTTQQVKLGTFSKLGEKGKNAEILKELLGPKEFSRLLKLQKNAGRLANAAQQFYNASKSGVVAADAAVLYKGVNGIANLLMGNPWPFARTAGAILGARKLSNLLADPKFLKMVEDVILASEKGTQQELVFSIEKLRPYILPAMQQFNVNTD